MSSNVPPMCDHCSDTFLSVEHLLSRCPHYGELCRRIGLKDNLRENLTSITQIEASIQFLKDCQLYNQI